MLKIFGKILILIAWAFSCWLVFQWARPVEYRTPVTNTPSASKGVSKITYTEAAPNLPPGWEINPDARFSYDRPPYLRPLDDQWKQEYLEALQVEDAAERYTKLNDLAESLRLEDFPDAILAMKAIADAYDIDEHAIGSGYGHLCFRWGSLDFHNAYAFMQQMDAPAVERNLSNVVLGFAHKDVPATMQWIGTLDEDAQEHYMDLIFSYPEFMNHQNIDSIIESIKNASPWNSSFYYSSVLTAYANVAGPIKAAEIAFSLGEKDAMVDILNDITLEDLSNVMTWIDRKKASSENIEDYKFNYILETVIISKQLESNPEFLLKTNPRYINFDHWSDTDYLESSSNALSSLIKTHESEVIKWLDNQPSSELKNIIISTSTAGLLFDINNNAKSINLLVDRLSDNTYLDFIVMENIHVLINTDSNFVTSSIPRLNNSQTYKIIQNSPTNTPGEIMRLLEPHLEKVGPTLEKKYAAEMDLYLKNEWK